MWSGGDKHWIAEKWKVNENEEIGNQYGLISSGDLSYKRIQSKEIEQELSF